VRLQAAVNRLCAGTYKQRYLATARAELADEPALLQTLARYRSLSSKGGTAVLTVLPSSCKDSTIEPEHLREVLRRFVGQERPAINGICAADTCAHPQTGPHARSCSKTGEHNFRHNGLRDEIAGWLTRVCKVGGVRTEDHQPFVDHGHADLKMDITVPAKQIAWPTLDNDGKCYRPPRNTDKDKTALIDLVCCDPTTASHIAAGSAAFSGAAARKSAKAKFNKYRRGIHYYGASFFLLPLALELFGYLGTHAQAFIKAVAAKESGVSGRPLSVCIRRWRQRISLALQRAVSVTVARNYARTRVVPGTGEAADVAAHMQVWLLAPPPPAVGAVGTPDVALVNNHSND